MHKQSKSVVVDYYNYLANNKTLPVTYFADRADATDDATDVNDLFDWPESWRCNKNKKIIDNVYKLLSYNRKYSTSSRYTVSFKRTIIKIIIQYHKILGNNLHMTGSNE